jgi:hypothetical protein
MVRFWRFSAWLDTWLERLRCGHQGGPRMPYFLPVAQFLNRDLVEVGCATLLTAFLCFAARRYPVLSARVARSFHASTRRTGLYILTAMLVPLVLRLALLPWVPPPEPHVHDEFGHLLVADTLAAGRLANPPHLLWRHLDTIYVLQQPSFASIYPIGQGAILAVGKVLTGNPWAGVLLSVLLMCGAISWMLFGCLPPAWAAVGGVLAALHYGLADKWVNSYFGGALCAFGGALLFGALCRVRRSPSWKLALLVGVGWSIVWLTRPFESLLCLMISWGIMAFIIRDSRSGRRWVGPIVVILSIQILAGCVTALHNRAVTGSFTTLPYQLSQKIYGVPQNLMWQKAIEEPPLQIAELKKMYRWQLQEKNRVSGNPVIWWIASLCMAWLFFIKGWYSLPLVLLVCLRRDRQVMFGVGMMACVLTASTLYPFFYPHYIAAYSCVIFFLVIRGMMKLYEWSFRGRRVGPVVVLFLALGGSIMALRIVPTSTMLRPTYITRQPGLRVQVSDQLMRVGGRHVVFVRYGANHSFHDEWVYNAADVDASPIVWCRAGGPADKEQVAQYYKDRRLWVVDVDGATARLSRYDSGPRLAAGSWTPTGPLQMHN